MKKFREILDDYVEGTGWAVALFAAFILISYAVIRAVEFVAWIFA